MLGAVIGDLAAWTYENDSRVFFDSLVSPDAVLSEFGRASLDAALAVCSGSLSSFVPRAQRGDWHTDVGCLLLQSLHACWTDGDVYEVFGRVRRIEGGRGDKAGAYFIRMATSMVISLRHGATRKDALSDMLLGANLDLDAWLEHEQDEFSECLSYLAMAKRCLEESWDFTSAVHRARFWECDRRFLFPLVGILAEAMYGCRYRLLKSAYTPEPFKVIPYPAELSGCMTMIGEYDRNHRLFFPKNDAMTNSERLTWAPVNSGHEGRQMSSAFAAALRKAFDTDWDNRYGFYLENGWEYVYRSGYLLARFRLVPADMDTFRIMDVQSHEGSKDDCDLAIGEALYSVKKIASRGTS